MAGAASASSVGDALHSVPAASFQDDFDLDGTPTVLAATIYSDRVFMVLSQASSLGSLIECTPAPPTGAMARGRPIIRTLVGDRGRDEANHVFAGAIASAVQAVSGLPVLVSLALREAEPKPECFRVIMSRVGPVIRGAAAARKASMAALATAHGATPAEAAPVATGAGVPAGVVGAEAPVARQLPPGLGRGPRAGPASTASGAAASATQ